MKFKEEIMKKILIIDDEEPIRKMLTKFLTLNGFDVISVSDGNKGIESYKDESPDLVITDLIMPEKNGLELIKELKSINNEIKIIAMTGGGITHPQMYLDLASKFGAERTFAKPVNNDDLLSAINEILS